MSGHKEGSKKVRYPLTFTYDLSSYVDDAIRQAESVHSFVQFQVEVELDEGLQFIIRISPNLDERVN
jgi:hypothetical protein